MRYKETASDSFFGSFLYDQKVSQDHFLRKLNEVIDWQLFTKKLIVHYKGKGRIGQAPYNPTIILKMLLLSYLWSVSERMVEELANDSLSVGLFLGIGANESVPDHSTLTLFKNRLIQSAGLKVYEGLFNEIVRIAQEKGVKFGKPQIIDGVHLLADVNISKDRRRQKEGKPPRDKDAPWETKGKKVFATERGSERRTDYFYGYKEQVSLNAEVGLVTTVLPGRADDYDRHKFREVVENDLKKWIQVGIVAADKGYDDGDNHYYLEEKGIKSAIRINKRRTRKKDSHKEGWLRLEASQEYQAGIKKRYQIERKFGEARKWHGFMRCHYLGYIRHAIQSYFTFMVLNLKRMVKLLTGNNFRGEHRWLLGVTMPIA